MDSEDTTLNKAKYMHRKKSRKPGGKKENAGKDRMKSRKKRQTALQKNKRNLAHSAAYKPTARKTSKGKTQSAKHKATITKKKIINKKKERKIVDDSARVKALLHKTAKEQENIPKQTLRIRGTKVRRQSEPGVPLPRKCTGKNLVVF